MWKTINKINKIKFLMQLFILAAIIFVWIFAVRNNIHPANIYTGKCFFYYKCHIFCPGCGGTRAFDYMLYGHLLKSLWYHPVVLFTLGTLLWSTLCYILYFITKGKILYDEFSMKHLIYINYVLLSTFVIRNVLALILNYYIF